MRSNLGNHCIAITASLAVFGSNEPFNQWQLHSGELIALLTAKDFE